jgi:hypothetical protein
VIAHLVVIAAIALVLWRQFLLSQAPGKHRAIEPQPEWETHTGAEGWNFAETATWMRVRANL